MTTKEEFNFWLEHPLTINFLEIIKTYRDYANKELLNGAVGYEGEKLLSMGQLIGRINAFDDMLAFSFDCIEEMGGSDE